MTQGRLEPPKLDDRTWQEIVEQTKTLIPKYAPDWTDHNPSDLGITLIELFAWLVEGLTYRLNRVPEQTYIHLLNLVGLRRRPATPAEVTLWFQPHNPNESISLKRGTQFATSQTESQEAVVFELDEPLTVRPYKLHTLLIRPKAEDPTAGGSESASEYHHLSDLDWSLESDAGASAPGWEGETTKTLAIGFEADAPPQSVTLIVQVEQSAEQAPWQIAWYYSKPTATPADPAIPGGSGTAPIVKSWTALSDSQITDGTGCFAYSGQVRLDIPADWPKQRPADWNNPQPAQQDPGAIHTTSVYWLGIEITNGSEKPRRLPLRYLSGNTARATNVLIQTETVAVSTGEPFQAYQLKQTPYLEISHADPDNHLIVKVQSPDGQEEKWSRVEEFAPGDEPVYRFDPASDTLYFGDNPARTSPPQGHGRIPPVAYTIRAQYRYATGGAAGNVPADTIRQPRNRSDHVQVTNPLPAIGGKDAETTDAAMARGPEVLRTRDRAITARDVEYLAREALPAAVKVRCLPPRLFTPQDVDNEFVLEGQGVGDAWRFGGINRDSGRFHVLIAPDDGTRRPTPTLQQMEWVRGEIAARSPLTATVDVHKPRYVAIGITLTVTMWKQAIQNGTIVKENYEKLLADTIRDFLHPIRGGRRGVGWDVGEDFFVPDLLEHLRPLIPPSIGYVTTIEVTAKATYDFEKPEEGRPLEVTKHAEEEKAFRVAIADFELICSGDVEAVAKPTAT